MPRPISIVHFTPDGLVRLVVESLGRHRWTGSPSGSTAACAWRLTTAREASRALLRAFAQIFPERRCAGRLCTCSG